MGIFEIGDLIVLNQKAHGLYKGVYEVRKKSSSKYKIKLIDGERVKSIGYSSFSIPIDTPYFTLI